MLTWDISSLLSWVKVTASYFPSLCFFLIIVSFLYSSLKKDIQIHLIKFYFLVQMIGKSN